MKLIQDYRHRGIVALVQLELWLLKGEEIPSLCGKGNDKLRFSWYF